MSRSHILACCAAALGASLIAPIRAQDAQPPVTKPAAQKPADKPSDKPQDGAGEIVVDRTKQPVPERMTQAEARKCLDRLIAYLLREQKEDGSWGVGVADGTMDLWAAPSTWRDWQIGANALACMALMEAPETPEIRAAMEKGLAWLVAVEDRGRGSDWDNDAVWAWVYTLVACERAAADPRFQSKSWRERIDSRGRESVAFLTRNQVPTGGWGYYDFPFPTQTPKWGTSFTTAAVVPAIAKSKTLGWNEDADVAKRAASYVRGCALPGGAYEYDLNPIPRIKGGEMINRVKGSLSRIQVCNWALASVGEKSVTPDLMREGLTNFFDHHKFLDAARMKPIPHESWYQNAAYFYLFGHHYAARVINLLPLAERESWHAKLRPHIAKVMNEDGSTIDFRATSWDFTAGTAMSALTLSFGLPPHVPAQP